MNSSFETIQFALNSAVSFVKEAHPAVKLGIVITGIATAAFLYYMRRPDPNKSLKDRLHYIETCNFREKLIGDEEFKKTVGNLYCLNDQYLLNTNLQLQKRPTRLEAILNQFKMMAFGCEDQFKNIRAKNVIPKLKEFVENNKNNLYCNEMNNFDVSKILDNFQERVKSREEHFNGVKEIKQSLVNVKPTNWKFLLQLKADITYFWTPFKEQIADACLKGDKEAFKLLKNIAELQAEKISTNWKIFENTGQWRTRTQPIICDFQTNHTENAYIQLSIVYFKFQRFHDAEEMIRLAFEKTNLKTESSTSMSQDYYEFFGKTCYSIGLEAKNKKTTFKEFFIAAQDYILNHVPSDVGTLVDLLSNSVGATEFRKKAIAYYESVILTSQVVDLDLYLSLMNLYKMENNSDAIIKIGQELFSNVNAEDPVAVVELENSLEGDELKMWELFKEAKATKSATDYLSQNEFKIEQEEGK